MENKNKRVLAYTLSKTIDNEALAMVSGGTSAQVTTQQTVKPSGNSVQNVDVQYDATVDW